MRWPGGCFADEYHWRYGIGPERPVTLNPNWGGVTEPNTFGTHEFMDFVEQIGSRGLSVDQRGLGHATGGGGLARVHDHGAADDAGEERAANGHPDPYEIPYLGIGNESWDCGGNMTPEDYLSQLKIYSRFVRNYNPAQQQDPHRMLKIAVGPGGDGPRWTEWTEIVMKAWQGHTWSWDIDGLSLHNYTVVKWPPSHASVGFGETEYAEILESTLEMDGLIATHSAIMDKYDPEKKIALFVDEWGAWYAPLPGSHPGFLAQQNSLRDAILAALNLNIFARHADRVRGANIAQMVNVLQAMILTDEEKMVLTPDLPRLQDVRALPGRHLRAGRPSTPAPGSRRSQPAAGGCGRGPGRRRPAVARGDESRPDRVRRDRGDPDRRHAQSGAGETLTAPAVDSVNSFEAPDASRRSLSR